MQNNYVNGPKTTKSKTNTQIFTQSQNVSQPIFTSVNFHDQSRSSQEQDGNYPVFQHVKTMQKNTIPKINLINTHKINFHQTMMNTIIRIINNFPQIQDLVLTVLINHNFQEQNPVNTNSYQPTQMQNEIPLPYYLQHEVTKSQLTKFSQMPHAAESLQMTMNPYLMG